MISNTVTTLCTSQSIAHIIHVLTWQPLCSISSYPILCKRSEAFRLVTSGLSSSRMDYSRVKSQLRSEIVWNELDASHLEWSDVRSWLDSEIDPSPCLPRCANPISWRTQTSYSWINLIGLSGIVGTLGSSFWSPEIPCCRFPPDISRVWDQEVIFHEGLSFWIQL